MLKSVFDPVLLDLKKNSEARMLVGNVVDIEDLVGYGQKNR